MTESPDTARAQDGDGGQRRRGGLSSMLVADLKAMATGLGIADADQMRKTQLVEAIKGAQAAPSRGGRAQRDQGQSDQGQSDQGQSDQGQSDRSGSEPAAKPQPAEPQPEKQPRDQDPSGEQESGKQSGKQQDKQQGKQQGKQESGKQQDRQQSGKQSGGQPEGKNKNQAKGKNNPPQQPKQQDQPKSQDQQKGQDGDDVEDDDGSGRSRNRRRRGRDRNRTTTGQRGEPDTTVLDDDVLVPAAGILDVLDNYAFVRTSGYLAGAQDVYLSLSMVRKHQLRRGDAVAGQVRQPREGERKEKFNPMVRIDSINGLEADAARDRPDFVELTPVHPDERLRLETGPGDVVGRVIDLVAPLGKGQRGLLVSPTRAGKTTVLQSVASSVTANNPECHLMVVLVDERPEEVTDFQRTVKGEVISSTFDRAPADHTALAELAIERAKRLVELGHDVVVLLDGITRLGRAYNLSASSGGRTLSGGVDSGALFPPKRFFGAARNVEDGGSLTILATATDESGSATDALILEEFEGTGNQELRLRRDLAEQGLHPAVDPVASGTRHPALLTGEQEAGILDALRADLAGRDRADALRELLRRVAATRTNIELLTQVSRDG